VEGRDPLGITIPGQHDIKVYLSEIMYEDVYLTDLDLDRVL
jgi:hypothetical protein